MSDNLQNNQPRYPTSPPPMSEAEKRRKEYPYQPTDIGLVLICLVLGYLFIEWVLFGGGGVGITAFSILFLGTMLFWMGSKGVKVTQKAFPWLGVVAALTLFPAISDNGELKVLSLLLLMVVVCYLAAVLGNTRAEGRLGAYFAADCWSAMFKMPFGNYGGAFQAIYTGAKHQRGGRNVIYLLIGLVVALPLLAITGGLLQQADAAFAALWSKIAVTFQPDGQEFTFQLIPALPVALYLFGLITTHVIHRGEPAITAHACETAAKRAKILPEMMLVGITVPILLLYIIFFLSQSAYSLSAFTGAVPSGTLPAEYARRGFFELCQVSTINLIGIALFRLFSKSRNKILPLLLSFFSVGMIVLSLSKMLLYIKFFGLTPKRLYTSWFMIFLLVVFVLTAISQWKPQVTITKKLVIIGLSMFLILCYANTDKIIAAYNINAYESGRLETLDIGLLNDLGYGATPYLIEALSSPRLTATQKSSLKTILQERLGSRTGRPWTYLNLDYLCSYWAIKTEME